MTFAKNDLTLPGNFCTLLFGSTPKSGLRENSFLISGSKIALLVRLKFGHTGVTLRLQALEGKELNPPEPL
jgi:hypothetical protein